MSDMGAQSSRSLSVTRLPRHLLGAELRNGYRFQHIVGVEFEAAAPESGFEYMMHRFVVAIFTGLGQQSGPFEWAKHAR